VDVGAGHQNSHVSSVVPSCLGRSVFGSCGTWPRGRCVAFVVSVLTSVRGLGTGVDVGAAALELSRFECCPSNLGRSVIGTCGARPRGWCVAFVVLILTSVCGLGSGVDAGAVAPERDALSVVPSCLGGSVVGSQVRGLGAGAWSLGCSVFASVPYKLTVWVRVCPLT
jgi:hypothetical protein